MLKAYDFDKIEDDFFYARGPQTRCNAKFTLKDGSLINLFNEKIGAYDYVSLISKEKYSAGTEVSMECFFEGTGAPCLVFTDDMTDSPEFPEYKLHFEVCIHKDGVNFWHILPLPSRPEWPVDSTNMLRVSTDIEKCGTLCKVKFGDKKIEIFINGKEYSLECEDFPESFHVGFTACEGFCGFKSFSVKTED